VRRGRLRAARRSALLAGALGAVAATLLALLLAPAAGAAPDPSATGRSLPIDIKLGRLHVGVTLPVTLGGLLGRTTPAATTPPTSSAPVSTPGRPTSARPYPPTLPSVGTSPATSAAAGAPATRAASASAAAHRQPAPSTSAAAAAPTRPSHATRTSAPPKKRGPGMVFVRGVVPSSGPALFILLCLACAVGVAFVVRLSGGRRRL
jgi:hypothetical protein